MDAVDVDDRDASTRHVLRVGDRERIESTLTPGPGGCHSCPFLGGPACIAGRCARCGGASDVACPDGG